MLLRQLHSGFVRAAFFVVLAVCVLTHMGGPALAEDYIEPAVPEEQQVYEPAVQVSPYPEWMYQASLGPQPPLIIGFASEPTNVYAGQSIEAKVVFQNTADVPIEDLHLELVCDEYGVQLYNAPSHIALPSIQPKTTVTLHIPVYVPEYAGEGLAYIAARATFWCGDPYETITRFGAVSVLVVNPYVVPDVYEHNAYVEAMEVEAALAEQSALNTELPAQEQVPPPEPEYLPEVVDTSVPEPLAALEDVAAQEPLTPGNPEYIPEPVDETSPDSTSTTDTTSPASTVEAPDSTDAATGQGQNQNTGSDSTQPSSSTTAEDENPGATDAEQQPGTTDQPGEQAQGEEPADHPEKPSTNQKDEPSDASASENADNLISKEEAAELFSLMLDAAIKYAEGDTYIGWNTIYSGESAGSGSGGSDIDDSIDSWIEDGWIDVTDPVDGENSEPVEDAAWETVEFDEGYDDYGDYSYGYTWSASDYSGTTTSTVAAPVVILKSYSYGKGVDYVEAGDSFKLSMTFENTSRTTTAEDVVIEINTEGQLELSNGANSFRFDAIPPGGIQQLVIDLKAIVGDASGASTLSISVKYHYQAGTERSETSQDARVIVNVKQPDRFELSIPEPQTYAYVGEPVSASIPYNNKGTSAVRNVEAYVVGGGLSRESTVIEVGTVEAGKKGSIGLNYTLDTPGSQDIRYLVEYEDVNGDTIRKEYAFSVYVEEMYSYVEEEGSIDDGTDGPEGELGETEASLTIPLPALIAGGAGLGAALLGTTIALIVSKRRKNKGAHFDDDDDFSKFMAARNGSSKVTMP